MFFVFLFFFLHYPLFCEGCGGSSRLSRHTSRSSITFIILLGWSPKRSYPRSSILLVHLVLGHPTGLLPFALASKACLVSLFPNSFCLHGHTIKAEACPAPQGGISEPCLSNHCLCHPSENCPPPSEDCAPKKVTGAVPLKRISGPVSPKILFVPPKAWVNFSSRTKNTSERKDKA